MKNNFIIKCMICENSILEEKIVEAEEKKLDVNIMCYKCASCEKEYMTTDQMELYRIQLGHLENE